MTKREYAEKVAERVGGVVQEVVKNNGVEMLAVTCKDGTNIGVVMYVDQPYKDGCSVEDFVEEYEKENEKLKSEKFDIDDVSNFESAKDKITVRLVNKKMNKDEDMFRSAEEYGFDDLIIVPYLKVNFMGKVGVTKITNNLISQWGVTADDVINIGIENLDYEVMPLAQKLFGDCGMMPAGFESPFTFVSTHDGVNGAAAIIKAKDELQKIHPDGYYVIPSSIHEMLVISAESVDEDRLDDLVKNVNSDILAETDILSDKAYKFVA